MTPRRDSGGANRIEEGARESRRSKLEFPTPSIDLSVHGYLVRFLSGLCLDRLSPASPHHQTMLPSQPRRRRRYELWLTCNGKGESGLKQIGGGADGDKGKEGKRRQYSQAHYMVSLSFFLAMASEMKSLGPPRSHSLADNTPKKDLTPPRMH